jgi:hypothetical protein
MFSFYKQVPEEYVNLGHDRFLPHPLKFVIHYPCRSENVLAQFPGQNHLLL